MPTALTTTLHRLVLLRGLTITAYALAMALAGWVLDWALPLVSLAFICLLLLAYNGFTFVRLRLARKGAAVSEGEIARQLAVDIVGHGMWLFFLGGATNPFTAWFLLPLTIAAASLSARFVWLLTLLTVLTYSTLLIWYQPLPIPDAVIGQAFFFHTLGMWIAFVAAAIIVASLVARIGRQLRDNERALMAAREAGMRQQQVMGLAIQAAGAAHRLGTPLATMTVLVDELRASRADDADLQADLTVLAQQLAACRTELQRLRDDNEHPEPRHADAAILAVLDDWRVVRPDARMEYRVLGTDTPPRVILSFGLRQALLNLFDNAADASPEWQCLTLDWSASRLRLILEDAGPGFDGSVGEPAEPSAEGLGVGVALSVSAIERAGGQLSWLRRDGGGTRVQIELPTR
ncbi:ATP-binding protein [Chitinimonas sp. BJYL2]|uniref:ATP-binding protein n=1 Tax=Chitinimonas sp. BJYL2 TaxID=2976696 RepID=UPI0022B3F314|nr:ATP-binding protein [Chitinimonas sp. BJYL2]